MTRITRVSTRQREPEWLDETSPGIAVRGCLRISEDSELCGIAQGRSTLMTSTLGVVERTIQSGFVLESGRPSRVNLRRMRQGEDYKFGFKKGFPKDPRKCVCGKTLEISQR